MFVFGFFPYPIGEELGPNFIFKMPSATSLLVLRFRIGDFRLNSAVFLLRLDEDVFVELRKHMHRKLAPPADVYFSVLAVLYDMSWRFCENFLKTFLSLAP